MAVVKHYTDKERRAIADRIGLIFDLPNAGMKMTEAGWSLESWGDQVQLKGELVAVISRTEAEALINAKPVEP